MRIVGAVFARGGSKGIVRKNLQEINGKTLVSKALQDLAESNMMDAIYLSSDDDEILKESSLIENVIPIKRPERLSTDDVNELDAWKHLLKEIKAKPQDMLVVAPATSPLRKRNRIRSVVETFKSYKEQIDGLVCTCEAQRHPSFNLLRLKDLGLQRVELWDKGAKRLVRRQEGRCALDLTTVAFAYNSLYIKNCESILDGRIYAQIIERKEALDIDTYDDLQYARYLTEHQEYEY